MKRTSERDRERDIGASALVGIIYRMSGSRGGRRMPAGFQKASSALLGRDPGACGCKKGRRAAGRRSRGAARRVSSGEIHYLSHSAALSRFI